MQLLKIFFDICLLRKGPEDVPFSYALLNFVIMLSIVVSIWIGNIIHNMKVAGISTIAGLFFSFVFVKILLFKRPERFLQTFIALLGTVTLINILSAPGIYLLSIKEKSETMQALIGLISFGLFIWVIVVCGHIFSKALSTPMGYGVAISAGYAVLSIILVDLILAGTAAS